MFLEERQEITDELRLNSIIIEYQKFTELSKNLQQHNSETVTNENNKKIFQEIPKERYIYIYIYIYIYPDVRQKIIDILISNIIVY